MMIITYAVRKSKWIKKAQITDIQNPALSWCYYWTFTSIIVSANIALVLINCGNNNRIQWKNSDVIVPV